MRRRCVDVGIGGRSAIGRGADPRRCGGQVCFGKMRVQVAWWVGFGVEKSWIWKMWSWSVKGVLAGFHSRLIGHFKISKQAGYMIQSGCE